eukprot:TRINITY_DN11888_c0_g1_i1.p1 TRINITY_DN11888_c0_g1~~TRINITY_DN11888_c0_g1_i1.p1  ORF type:complete len:372 (-),score=47.02 TRINITY_DN11888_c0_g1_i1:326-1441(-)
MIMLCVCILVCRLLLDSLCSSFLFFCSIILFLVFSFFFFFFFFFFQLPATTHAPLASALPSPYQSMGMIDRDMQHSKMDSDAEENALKIEPKIDPIPHFGPVSTTEIDLDDSIPILNHKVSSETLEIVESPYVKLNMDVLGVIFCYLIYGIYNPDMNRVWGFSTKSSRLLNQTYRNWCSFRRVSKEWRDAIDRIYIFPQICLERSILNGNESSFFYLLNKNGIRLGKNTTSTDTKMFSPFRGKTEPCNNLCVLAASKGNINIFNHLLKESDSNPSVQKNLAFRWACSEGHLQMVRHLLQNKHVDPTALKNQAIQAAAFRGKDSVVNMLLKDERVDPSDNEDLAICSVVSILAAHPVNPEAKCREMPEGNQG